MAVFFQVFLENEAEGGNLGEQQIIQQIISVVKWNIPSIPKKKKRNGVVYMNIGLRRIE